VGARAPGLASGPCERDSDEPSGSREQNVERFGAYDTFLAGCVATEVEAVKNVKRFPNVLVPLGVRPGDRVAVMLPNYVVVFIILETTRRYAPDAVFILTSIQRSTEMRSQPVALGRTPARYEIESSQAYVDGMIEEMPIERTLRNLFGASKVDVDVVVQEYGRTSTCPPYVSPATPLPHVVETGVTAASSKRSSVQKGSFVVSIYRRSFQNWVDQVGLAPRAFAPPLAVRPGVQQALASPGSYWLGESRPVRPRQSPYEADDDL
jgi:hypothetical protein